MMHGVIEFLLSDEKEAQNLRDKFIFKIIPILNPDGVIYGNYRSSLIGVDLNRRWKNPSKFLHPTIYYSKSLIKCLNAKKKQGVMMACDFHGHSRKTNVFMYSCCLNGTEPQQINGNSIIHQIPESVNQICPIFSLKDCKFVMEKEKETTARIVLFKEFGILNSYTLESTFYGSEMLKKPIKRGFGGTQNNLILPNYNIYNIGEGRQDMHITTLDLMEVGKDFCRGINFSITNKVIQQHWFPDIKKISSPNKKSQINQNKIQSPQVQQPKIIEGKNMITRRNFKNKCNNNSEFLNSFLIQQTALDQLLDDSRMQVVTQESKTYSEKEYQSKKESSENESNDLYNITDNNKSTLTILKRKRKREYIHNQQQEGNVDDSKLYQNHYFSDTYAHLFNTLQNRDQDEQLDGIKTNPYQQQLVQQYMNYYKQKSPFQDENSFVESLNNDQCYKNIDNSKQSKSSLKDNYSVKSLSNQIQEQVKLEYDEANSINVSPEVRHSNFFQNSPNVKLINNRLQSETIHRVRLKNPNNNQKDSTPMKLPYIFDPNLQNPSQSKSEDKIKSLLQCSLNQKVQGLGLVQQVKQIHQKVRKANYHKQFFQSQEEQDIYPQDFTFVPNNIMGQINSLHPLLQQINVGNKHQRKYFQIKEYNTNLIAQRNNSDVMRMTSMCNFKSPVNGTNVYKNEYESQNDQTQFIDVKMVSQEIDLSNTKTKWQQYQEKKSFQRVHSNKIQQHMMQKRKDSKKSFFCDNMPKTFYIEDKQQKLLNASQASNLASMQKRKIIQQHSLKEEERKTLLQSEIQSVIENDDRNDQANLTLRSDREQDQNKFLKGKAINVKNNEMNYQFSLIKQIVKAIERRDSNMQQIQSKQLSKRSTKPEQPSSFISDKVKIVQ